MEPGRGLRHARHARHEHGPRLHTYMHTCIWMCINIISCSSSSSSSNITMTITITITIRPRAGCKYRPPWRKTLLRRRILPDLRCALATYLLRVRHSCAPYLKCVPYLCPFIFGRCVNCLSTTCQLFVSTSCRMFDIVVNYLSDTWTWCAIYVAPYLCALSI